MTSLLPVIHSHLFFVVAYFIHFVYDIPLNI